MITVDLKSLLERLNPLCTRNLEAGAGLCVSRSHYEVTVEHFFIKLLEEKRSDFFLALEHFGISEDRMLKALEAALEEAATGNTGKPVFSPLLMELFQEGWLISSVDFGAGAIRSGAILAALLSSPSRYSSSGFVEHLKAVRKDELKERFRDIFAGSDEEAVTGTKAAEPAMAEGSALARFCEDFTAKAFGEEIDPVFGRDKEIRQMIDIFARRRKNNPIVVGEPGVGKTAVVEGLALSIAKGDVPDFLKDVKILGLDMGRLQAGAGMKGEFENRLKQVMEEVKASVEPIILFIDEAHTLVGAGGPSGGGDAANLMKPALARGELRTVAATTWSEYKKYFEKDAALARRFQLVKLDEPSVETTALILRGLKEKYEASHDVVVRDDAVKAAAELSDRYISGRKLPDKAVDLLDTSSARVKVNLTAKPDVLEDKERALQALEREKRALDRDKAHDIPVDGEHYEQVLGQMETLQEESAALESKWKAEKTLAEAILERRSSVWDMRSNGEDEEKIAPVKAEVEGMLAELAELQGEHPLVRIEVDPDTVAKVVSDWTGIPLGSVNRDQSKAVLAMEAAMQSRIKGQDHAVAIVGEALKAARADLNDPGLPMGVFILAGPSGTGKTETALAVADTLFGGERSVTTINMSEFQEAHTVSRLIGSPPGYVGFGEGGILTEAVRQRPYSVILLDEVEKAHLEVLNLFYQVFDKGTLSDGEGRVVDFKNTVIFLTSNLATDVITEMCSGDERPPLEAVSGAVRPILSNHFRPALLARMTMVPFFTLPQDVLKDITLLKLNKLVTRMLKNHKMHLEVDESVMNGIAERCTEVETGARNIDSIIRGTILPLLSREILAKMSEGAMPSKAVLGLAPEGGFHIDFEE
jgi:type VI secretion system protein VasG